MVDNTFKLYWFFKYLPWVFPFFNISDDANFGTTKINSDQLRFSFFSLKLGSYIIYIFSIGYWRGAPKEGVIIYPKGFKSFYYLKLTQYGRVLNENKINQLKTDHTEFLHNHKDPEKRVVYKEILMYKLDQLTEKKNRTFNKGLAYLAVVAFVIPIYVSPALKFKEIFDKPTFTMITYFILSIYLVYYLLNFTLLFFSLIQVKVYSRLTYGSIKKADEPEDTFLNGLYIDFQMKEDESVKEVSHILNIEYVICALLIASTVLGIFHIFLGSNSEMKPNPSQTLFNNQNQVLHFNLDQTPITLITGQENNLNTIKFNLLQNRIKRILLIKSGNTNDNNYTRIANIIKSYNVNNIEITEIVDKLFKQKDDLQIIIEGR
jgi:hypothetical protein